MGEATRDERASGPLAVLILESQQSGAPADGLNPGALRGPIRFQSTDEVDLWVGMKMVTGPDGKPFGPSGFVVNCPLISIDIP